MNLMRVMDLKAAYHQIKSASAIFQKGIYHLFVLKNESHNDLFAQVLRLYQSLFQLCMAYRLLDINVPLQPKGNLRKELRQFNEIDPAATIKHYMFEDEQAKDFWSGFQKG